MKKLVLCIEFILICIFLVIPPLYIKTPQNNIDLKLSPYTIILLFISLFIFYQFEFRKANKLEKINFYQLISKSFIYTFILIIIHLIISAFSYFTNQSKNIIFNIDNTIIGILLIILNLLISAFYEEVIYRLFLPEAILKLSKTIINLFNKDINKFSPKVIKTGKYLIEFICILIFAFSHRYNGIIAVINAFLAGSLYRYCRIKNKTILISTISHFIYNCYILILAYQLLN